MAAASHRIGRSKTTAGYSGTPLANKLGIKEGGVVLLVDAPNDYAKWVAPLPEGVLFRSSISGRVDIAHVFVTRRASLSVQLAKFRRALNVDASVWISWPKKVSKVSTDITEGIIREVALPLGYVDIKVCAVSDVWSGLKLVVRKGLR